LAITKKTPESNSEWWIRSTPETAAFFGVTEKTINMWAKQGAPKKSRGVWDIRALVNWKYRSESSPEQRKLEAEAALKETKSELERIKLEVAKGNYIETTKVTAELKRIFSGIKKTLLGMGHKVAAETNSLNPEFAMAANKVVDETVKETLQQLSEGRLKR